MKTYLYFDRSGYLREIVNAPVRQGGQNVNEVWFYLEPTINQVDAQGRYLLPTNWKTGGTMTFKFEDSGVSPIPLTFTSDDIDFDEVDYDAKRDLKYFKYFKQYEFYKVELTATILANDGNTTATIRLINGSAILPLDTYCFFIEESNTVASVQITDTEYHYLLGQVNEIKTLQENAVPYTGASDDVNLGNHGLKANTVGVYYNGTTWCGGFGSSSNGNLYIESENAVVLDAPSCKVGSYEIATQNWVESQGYLTEHQSLAGYVPYTDATNDVDLGAHDILARYLKAGTSSKYTELEQTGIRSINLNNVAGYSFLQFPDTRGSGQSTGSDYIATRKETKLYRHIVQVADYGHSDYVTLVIISKNANSIDNTLSDLGDAISGFVSGFYEDEHSLIFPLLECSVNLTTFGFAYIDENHEFWDATWNSAIVSNDIVEEI